MNAWVYIDQIQDTIIKQFAAYIKDHHNLSKIDELM